MKQIHARQCGQVETECGLDRNFAHPKVRRQRGKGGEIGINGKWPQSRQPGDLPAFNRELIALLVDSRSRQRVA